DGIRYFHVTGVQTCALPILICGEEKEISEYNNLPKMADGHLNKCKQCTKDGVKKRYYQLSNNPEWVESERSRHKEKYHRLGYKEIGRASCREREENCGA